MPVMKKMTAYILSKKSLKNDIWSFHSFSILIQNLNRQRRPEKTLIFPKIPNLYSSWLHLWLK